jgi:hypothetical protein
MQRSKHAAAQARFIFTASTFRRGTNHIKPLMMNAFALRVGEPHSSLRKGWVKVAA